MTQIAEAGETISLIELQDKGQAEQGKTFNIFGFLGCCYHCKHEPKCTENCMSRHHIANGSEAEERAKEQSAMSRKRIFQAAEAVSFVQQAASYHKHKAIKLHLAQGNGRVHKAPAKPQRTTNGAKIAAAAGHALRSESDSTNGFDIHSFFHCAYSCHHQPSCEKGCLARHHIQMSTQNIKEENTVLRLDDDSEDND